MLLYTFFIINVTILCLVAALYWFSSRLLGYRLFAFVGYSWLLNCIYLIVESSIEQKGAGPNLPLLALAVGVLPTLVLHLGVPVSQSTSRKRAILGRLGVGVAIAAAGAILSYTLALEASPVTFAILSLPPVAYTFFVLFSVSFALAKQLPEGDYGYSARLLFGSWAFYGFLQIFYPFRMLDDVKNFTILLFFAAFCTKLIGAGALLGVVRQSYQDLQLSAQHSSVIAELGDLAAGVYHDIATPVGSIDFAIHDLRTERSQDASVTKFLTRMERPMRAIRAALQIMDLARQDPDKPSIRLSRTNIRAIANRSIKLFRQTQPVEGHEITSRLPSDLYVHGSIEYLAPAVVNIIKNAYEAGARRVHLTAGKVVSEGKEGVRLTIANDGREVTEEEIRHCRKAGWSSKRDHRQKGNVGMGLYMANKIIQLHRGSLDIQNVAGSLGVEVVIELQSARGRTN